MFAKVWKELPSDFRADFLRKCLVWWREDEGGEAFELARLVAKVTHTREKTVLAQMRRGDVTGLRIVIGRFPDHAVHFLSSTLTTRFPPELAEVHRVLRTEMDPESGRPVEKYGEKAPALEDMKRLVRGEGLADLAPFARLVVGITATIGTDAWRSVAVQALLECEAAPGDLTIQTDRPASEAIASITPAGDGIATVDVPSVDPRSSGAGVEEGSDDDSEEDDSEEEEGVSASEQPRPTSPTEFDRVLIDAAVQAANGAAGARTLEQVAAIADEVVRLNDKRFPSQAFLGFVDALRGREIRPPTAGGNLIRRVWYLKGFLEGHRRTDSDAAFLTRVRTLDPVDVAAFETASTEFPRDAFVPRSTVSDMVVRAAMAMDDLDTVQLWYSVMHAPNTFEPVFEWLKRMVRSGDPKRPLPLLKLIRRQIKDFRAGHRARGLDESEDFSWVFEKPIGGLEATALRLCGRFDDSIQRLERLQQSLEASEFDAALWGSLALAKLRITRIEEIPLQGTAIDSLIRRLPGVASILDKASEDRGYAPALYLLALPTVFSRNSTRHERATALERLRRASGLLSSLETELAQGPFPRIVEAMAAILELQDGKSEQLGTAAASSLLRALEDGLRLDSALVREAGEFAIALGAPEAESIFRHSFALGATLDEALPVEELVAKSPVIASALLDQSDQRAMTAAERSRLEVRILRGLTVHPEPLKEIRERCADRLEVRAASDRAARKELVELLESDGSAARPWKVVWDEEERDSTLVWCHLQDGRLDRVGQLLTQMGFAALGSSRKLLAQDCSDQIDSLGLPNALADSLRAGRTPPPRPIAGDRPRIALVGGNEVQGQYESRLNDWFAKEWPHGRLRICRTGWSANWPTEIHELDRQLDSYHAVVILAFVRTNLGRYLRRRVNDEGLQWFSCTGHGYESLRRSVEFAVGETVGKRKKNGA
jgi:hypothetical protein